MPAAVNVRHTKTKCCASCENFSVTSAWEEDVAVECDLAYGPEWDSSLSPILNVEPRIRNDDGPGNFVCDTWQSWNKIAEDTTNDQR